MFSSKIRTFADTVYNVNLFSSLNHTGLSKFSGKTDSCRWWFVRLEDHFCRKTKTKERVFIIFVSEEWDSGFEI